MAHYDPNVSWELDVFSRLCLKHLHFDQLPSYFINREAQELVLCFCKEWLKNFRYLLKTMVISGVLKKYSTKLIQVIGQLVIRKKYWMNYNLFIDYVSFYPLIYYSLPIPWNSYFSLKPCLSSRRKNVGCI